MRKSTYNAIRNVLFGYRDTESLAIARHQETDPFLQKRLEMYGSSARPFVNWCTLPYTTQFQSVPARERLDHVVYTFLLRFAVLLKEEYFGRTLVRPGSASVMIALTNAYKMCVFSMLKLLYGVEWTSKRLFLLDKAVPQLIHNDRVLALRELCTELGVSPIKEELTVAESQPEQLMFLGVDQFVSFYWRAIHWIAEAINLKKNDKNDPDVQLAISL